MLLGVLVAAQAAVADLLRRSILEGENFCFVPSAFYMFFAGPVAGLATVPFRTFVRIKLSLHRRGNMRRGFVILVEVLRRHVFVTGLASFGAHVEAGIRRRNICFALVRWLFFLVVRMGKRN